MDSHIIHASTIKGDGSWEALKGQAVADQVKADEFAWVHLDGNLPETRTWLEQELSYLDSIIIDALLVSQTRPRNLEFDEGVLIILRGVNLNENAG